MIIDTGAYVMSLILVLIGSIVRDFVIPLFVWKKHLKDKNYSYRFMFCIITQAALQINLVLLLGLFNILNSYTFVFFNIVIYLLIIWNYSNKQFFKDFRSGIKRIWRAHKEGKFTRYILQSLSSFYKKTFRAIWQMPIWKYIKKHWLEVFILIGLAIYNIWFLTHNTITYHSYQFSDIPVHQSWIYQLEQGNIYSEGIYPFGMHSMIYFIRIVFRFNLREIMLYAGAYQTVILIISIYLLSKEIFSGKYTPITTILITSFMLNQDRYAASLPQEFGMYAVIAMAYFLIRYLHSDKKKIIIKNDSKIRRAFRINSYINSRYIGSEMLLLMLTVALVISYHYYTAIAAVFVIISIGLAYIPKIIKKQYFVPLLFCGIMGAAIAIVPTGVALVKGIPFQESIAWATTVMSGDEWHGSEADYKDELDTALGNENTDVSTPNTDEVHLEGKQKVDYSGKSFREIIKYYFNSIYSFGKNMLLGYGPNIFVFKCIIFGLILALLMIFIRSTRNTAYDYMAFIITMMMLYTLGASRELGIPELIAADRATTFAQPFIGIIYMMPLDFVFRILGKIKKPYFHILTGYLSLLICGIMGFLIIDSGWYHDYFDVNQAYYNEPEYVLRHIKKSFNKNSYTIVATTDEYYDVIDYGRHTELSRFVNLINKKEDNFTFTTDYVFFFIEKVVLQDYNYGRVKVDLKYAEQDFLYLGDIQDYYFQRAVMESKAYYWAKAFQKIYPRNFKVYYEDDIYIVYMMEQNTYFPYNLQIDYLAN